MREGQLTYLRKVESLLKDESAKLADLLDTILMAGFDASLYTDGLDPRIEVEGGQLVTIKCNNKDWEVTTFRVYLVNVVILKEANSKAVMKYLDSFVDESDRDIYDIADYLESYGYEVLVEEEELYTRLVIPLMDGTHCYVGKTETKFQTIHSGVIFRGGFQNTIEYLESLDIVESLDDTMWEV